MYLGNEMHIFKDGVFSSIQIVNYKEDIKVIQNINIICDCKINNYITLINEFVYNDKKLTERQKDKMNYIIFNKYIR